MKYREALAHALVDSMKADPKVLCMGVGVGDEKGIFGTTKQAHDAYPDRVMETPLSENMLTGACVGLAMEGYHPVLVHARMDFTMLTMEHIVNTAAKWRYMGGSHSGITIRCIVGRGWGQGPQHSQDLKAMFAHVPGLRVYMPYRPSDAYYALRHAISTPDPVIVVEHRRLYETDQEFLYPSNKPETFWAQGERTELFAGYGERVCIVGMSAALVDAQEAAKVLHEQGVSTIVYDPQAWPLSESSRFMLLESVRDSDGRLVVVDTAHATAGLSAEVVAMCAEEGVLKAPPVRVTPPFSPCPTSYPLEQAWYPTSADVVKAVYKVMAKPLPVHTETALKEDAEMMALGQDFKGPF